MQAGLLLQKNTLMRGARLQGAPFTEICSGGILLVDVKAVVHHGLFAGMKLGRCSLCLGRLKHIDLFAKLVT